MTKSKSKPKSHSRSKAVKRLKPILAAGGAVWRHGDEGREVLVVHRPRYDDWSLPKGKRSGRESAPATAIREIEEETGWRVRLGPALRTVTYEFDGRPKEVRYWMAEPISYTKFVPNDEVDLVEWLTLAQARERLRPHDLALAHATLKAGRPSRPTVVVRHGYSMRRKEWSEDDRDRPLSRDGKEQADRLVDLLGAWSPTRIVTSTSRRCRDTVEPLAARTGLPLELREELSEEAYERDPNAARTLITDLRASREPVVVCTHRPLLAMAARVIGLELPRQARSNPLPKGACWVAHAGPKDPVERYTG